MMRVTLESLLLFLVPFGVYALWAAVARRAGLDTPTFNAMAARLTAAGLILVAVSFLFMGVFAERHQAPYVPAHMENGQLVPGEFK